MREQAWSALEDLCPPSGVRPLLASTQAPRSKALHARACSATTRLTRRRLSWHPTTPLWPELPVHRTATMHRQHPAQDAIVRSGEATRQHPHRTRILQSSAVRRLHAAAPAGIGSGMRHPTRCPTRPSHHAAMPDLPALPCTAPMNQRFNSHARRRLDLSLAQGCSDPPSERTRPWALSADHRDR